MSDEARDPAQTQWQTVDEALEELCVECRNDKECRQTAVTDSTDGVPLCDYHAGTVLNGGGQA